MKTTTHFKTLHDIVRSVATILQPAERMSVSAAAEKYRYLNTPGAYVGWYKNSHAWYMVEPMDTFTSRVYSGMAFVGPAQSAKTEGLVLNTASYTIKCDPMDMMIVCPTMTAARDFSIRRIDRMHRNSKDIGEMLLPGADNDNKFDKQYNNGMLLTLSWPTPTELAGKPIGRIVLTDRDRMTDDVDGDGDPFDLASKRTTTFGSYAMTVAESSPSRPVKDTKWIPRTAHEAPPADGILALYNRGDRRRWYWPCPSCGTYFEGMFEFLTYERIEGATNLETAETVRMRCPHCPYQIHPDERDEMQRQGRWVKDGQKVDSDGKIYGANPRTRIASFWLRGVAAAFASWKSLVAVCLDAQDDYERTGSEEALKKFYNNDLGEPYTPKSMENRRSPEALKAMAETLRERHVPPGVRFLVATIDSQKNMWVVQVFGISPGIPFDSVLIDRFDIRKSKRTDDDGDAIWVKPNAHLEDWDELIEHVIEKEYPLDDDSGRFMAIKYTGCDSGGAAGVTTMAYNFYRKLRGENKHRRFILLKGDPLPKQPRTRTAFPDSSRKDRNAGARGDIPVLMLNSNALKDMLDGRLDCVEPGKGMFRVADWIEDKFFTEMCAEIRTPKGWEDPTGKRRNEAIDLSYYMLGLCVSEYLGVERLNWDNPPTWAAEWDRNTLVRKPAEPPRFANTIESAYDFSALAKDLA